MGNYEPFEVENSRIYGYIRRYKTDSLLVLNNFSDAPINVTVPDEFLSGNILISNVTCETLEKELDIQPYQSLAIYVQK